jgi:protease I
MDAQKRIDGMKVAILATDGFEEVELVDPRNALDSAGAKTTLIAPHGGSIQGFKHHDKAGTVKVDATFGDANVDDFDAILLPGGALNADALRAVPEAKQFVQKLFGAGKPIAVICHGPWILASAGLLKGRTITSYHTIQDDLRNAGARWEDREVVRDGNLVSSRKPADIPAFDRAMIDLFAEHVERRSSIPAPGARR